MPALTTAFRYWVVSALANVIFVNFPYCMLLNIMHSLVGERLQRGIRLPSVDDKMEKLTTVKHALRSVLVM
jgi:hypothetical protein